MQINKLARLFLIFILLSFTVIEAKAQWEYNIAGTIKKDKKKVEGAVVTLYKGSVQVQQISTTSSGKFSFNLDQNSDYTLSVTKANHITKKFLFNTKGVPEERAKEPFGGQDLEISIFEMPKDQGVQSQINSILKSPIAKFYYDDGIKEFTFDKGYSQSMQDALAKLQVLEQEANKKAAEEAKQNANMESAAAGKYDAAIAKGDAAFSKKDYATAKAAYNEAIGVKATEAYPKTKIVEIDKILADLAEKDKANKDLNDKYTAAITKADNALAAKTYDAAKAGYNEALGLKPSEAYPKTKLAEIDKILTDLAAKDKAEKDKLAKEKELNDKYNAAIAKGDKALAAKTYDVAKTGYNEALALKPTEAYPKTKLAEIDKLIAELALKDKADKELNDKYNAAIAKGDKALAAKTYDAAKAGYNEALGFKPAEAYPKSKLAEIDKLMADSAAKDAAEKDKLAKEKELNDKYTAAIAKGDKALASKTYDAAKAGYNEALGLKPSEAYPKTKLAEIDKALADLAAKDASEKDRLAKEKELNDKYNVAIGKADKEFAAKTYDPAKVHYNEALGFKPSEAYPKTKLAEIDKILSDLAAKDASEKDRLAKEKELNDKYNAAIAKADAAFKTKTYDAAKAGYNEALGFKPSEAYPKTKLAEIEKALADAAAKDASDKDRLAKEKELNEKYAAAITKGDKALAEKTYDAAKTAYNEALALKATEKYPKDKIAEINAILAKEIGAKELEKKYADAIVKGDAALATKEYVNAKTHYSNAVGFKPTEKYPKDKIAEIDKALADLAADKDKLAQQKALEVKYAAAIVKGDKAMLAKTYDAGKAAYNEALGVKPSEQYPKDKLAEIEKILAALANKNASEKELNEKYAAAVAKGDKAFAAKTYDAAKAGYNEALGFKPTEAYPKTKLAEIEKALADAAAKDASDKDRLAKEKELNEKYAAAITKGDKALAEKAYDAAKTAYNEALTLKATEKYPKDKIAEINAILAKEIGAKELEKKYADAIAKGDAALATKEYVNAKTHYSNAVGFKPTEKYPKDKIAEIDKALADLAADKDKLAQQKSLEAKYAAAIVKGDKALAAKTYDPAKAAYNEALGVKPSEQYPKDKLAEIEKILAALANKNASEKELNDKYNAAIAKADAALKTKTYDAAKSGYNEALGFKPTEAYPKTKLAEIEKALADAAAKDASDKDRLAKEKELNEKYAAAITKGDKALAEKAYDAAKTAYNEALTLKAAEKYPKDKIAEINAILAKEMGAKELEKKYADAIAKGDAALATKEYVNAKTQYTNAVGFKPTEKYPKDKIAEIDKALADLAADKDKLAQQKALEAKYAAAIARGDKAMLAKTYDAGKAAYNEALGLKPSEQYPKDKLAEIEKILAALANKNASEKELNEKYAAAVAKGDKAFAAKTYDAAKAGYNEALGIKPTEKYPKDKITAIDELIAKEAGAKELNEKYNAAISKGDAAFNTKDYTSAKDSYTEALGLKTTELYPKRQLDIIAQYLADVAKTKANQEKYKAIISKADELLTAKDYTKALASYKEAQAIKPNEPYPTNKITEINRTLDALSRSKEKEQHYKDLIVKGDKLFTTKDYKQSKSAFQDALLIKPTEQYPKDKVAEIDELMKKKTTTTAIVVENKDEFKNELAKKYPQGITEEYVTENNAKVTKRIVVKGNEGHLYIKKETSFGPIYYFKDNVPITEGEFLSDTELQPQ